MICPDFPIVNNSLQDGVDNILFTYENTELRRALRNLANARDISYPTVSHKSIIKTSFHESSHIYKNIPSVVKQNLYELTTGSKR